MECQADTQDNQSLPYSITHYFLAISSKLLHFLKKHLQVKNGIQWDSLLKNVSRATKKTCIYKTVDKNIPLDCLQKETETTDKDMVYGINQTGLLSLLWYQRQTLLISSFSVFCR